MMAFRFNGRLPGILLVASLLAGCSLLYPGKAYKLEIEGKEARHLRKDLEALISSGEEVSAVTPSREIQELFARGDAKNMQSYMRASGFYDARITYSTDGGSAAIVSYTVKSGPLYRLEQPVVEWTADHEDARRIIDRHFSSPREDPAASSRNMIKLREEAIRSLKESGYPQATARIKDIVVDHQATHAKVFLEINPGVRGTLGQARLSGTNKLKRIRSGYLEKAQSWTNGQPYDVRTVEEFEQQLAASGLFSTILSRTVPADAGESAGQWFDVELSLQERKHRTLQLGIGYTTDKGAESSAQWQHRNLIGQGENLVLRGNINEEGYEAETRFTVPFLFRHDQRWISSALVREEESDAYITRGVEASTRLARDVTPDLLASLGLAVSYLRERQGAEEDNFLLASSPFEIDWDRSDNRLDARKGFRLLAETEPFQGIRDPELFFWKNIGTARAFLPLRRDKRLALAARLTAGYITGDKLGDIPAETRFYGGGGQSVRGYAYQSLSPRLDDQVLGGMSLLESSFEIRAQAGEKAGFVLFVDGGSAFEKDIQVGGEEYRWGAGGGFRYFAPVGPIRADAGFPLEPRKGIDDDWQFYISIGQAF